MILIFSPQKRLDLAVSTKIDVIDENSIVIDGIGYHISPNIIDLNKMQGSFIHGYRDESGTLVLRILYQYSPNDSKEWETPPYRGTEPETWMPSGNPPPGQMIELTGKTASELEDQSKKDSVESIKIKLLELDKTIPRWGEDLCDQAKFTPFQNVTKTIKQKVDLRGQLRKLLSNGGN